jgi:energy-coupling factor transport system substrate-specific component
VSWQVGAFSLLAVALAGGFAWYERDRPDARIVALVATLAAFAALGRVAFAAVPNVKPTTDIVLIAGYALGGGPGFAVGALAGLVSNFFFGQGPWTPWQMAGWGAIGLSGAGLARLVAVSRRSRPDLPGDAPGTDTATAAAPVIGRLALAAVCCVAGFAFTGLQDVGDWVTYSDHSLAQLNAYVASGLGFDAIHAAGCVAFALAFGPALLRSIQRFAQRLQVRWLPPGTALPLVLLAGLSGLAGSLAPGLGAPAAAQAAAGLSSTFAYLQRAQNPDGGFGAAPGQPSSQLYSGWAALGLASAGYDPAQLARGPHNLAGYIAASAAGRLDTGALERTILAMRASGGSARSVDGRDLVAMLLARLRPDGSFSELVNLTAFAVLALRSAQITPDGATLHWLIRQQNPDGGFSFAGRGGQSDIDDTGATLEALAGVGAADRARARAVGYLRGRQDGDGGLPSQPGMGSNAQSTAWAVQGLDAAGVDPATLHLHGAQSPLGYLQSLIGSDGSVAYARGQRQTPVWVTGEALMALEGTPLPLAAVTPRHQTPAPKPHRTSAAHPGHRTVHRRQSHGTPRRAAPSAGVSERRLEGMSAGAGLVTALLLAPVGMG